MSEVTERQRFDFLSWFGHEPDPAIAKWLAWKKGEELIAILYPKNHAIYIFLNHEKDRWSVYCTCEKCNGLILRFVKSISVFNLMTKISGA